MSLIVWCWREKIDSSAGKQTWDLSIKLRVLYQLSYQGIHALPPNKSPSGYYMCFVHQTFRLMTCRPVVEAFIFNEQGYSRLLEHNFFLMENRCLWQSGVGEKKNWLPQLGKQTQDLSIKLWVLYQLSYQGIYAFLPNKSTIRWLYMFCAPNPQADDL